VEQKVLDIITKIDIFYKELYEKTNDSVQVSLKDNGTSVSQFDLDATAFCIELINESFPNANIWIEEDQAILKEDENEYTFIIDPLDGTASFLRGYPIWGIGIGVLKGSTPLLSYFYGPACNQKYLAYDEKIFINDKELHSDNNVINADTKTIFISSRLHKKIDFKAFEELKLRNFGSTLYHVVMVALGKAESVLIGSCYIWDLAAAFYLGEKHGYAFYDFNVQKQLSIQELLAYKSKKIDIILEFKKV
jgi:fructose-1,6-bisphosphatase/inositol monophosphatase family enzyme